MINICQDPATSLSEGASLWINLKPPPPLQAPQLEIDPENETEVEEFGLGETESEATNTNTNADAEAEGSASASIKSREKAFLKRMKMALTPYALAAFFLDPRYYDTLRTAIDVDVTAVANKELKEYYLIFQKILI